MKKKTILLAVLTALLMIVGFACSTSSLLSAPSKKVQSNEVLFQDDFSDPTSGWDTWSEGSSSVHYEEGGLRFQIHQPHFDFWSRPGKRFDQVRLAVNVIKLDGPDNNDFGLICRFQDKDHYYAFLVSSDGYQGIVKVKDGLYSILSGEHLKYSEAIRRGLASNQLQADCIGSSLMLSVNGETVAAAQDADFSHGEIGLIAGTFETPGVDILFDDFVATRP